MTTVIKPTQPWDEDPIILCIVCITITITLIGDFIKCLLTLHHPVAGSQGTTCTVPLKTKSQPPSVSTNVPVGTVDQKKVGGTTSKGGPSPRSASSPRSKPSAKQSSLKQKHWKSSDPNETTSDGTHGVLLSPTVTPKRTPKNVRIIADATSRTAQA